MNCQVKQGNGSGNAASLRYTEGAVTRKEGIAQEQA